MPAQQQNRVEKEIDNFGGDDLSADAAVCERQPAKIAQYRLRSLLSDVECERQTQRVAEGAQSGREHSSPYSYARTSNLDRHTLEKK